MINEAIRLNGAPSGEVPELLKGFPALLECAIPWQDIISLHPKVCKVYNMSQGGRFL